MPEIKVKKTIFYKQIWFSVVVCVVLRFSAVQRSFSAWSLPLFHYFPFSLLQASLSRSERHKLLLAGRARYVRISSSVLCTLSFVLHFSVCSAATLLDDEMRWGERLEMYRQHRLDEYLLFSYSPIMLYAKNFYVFSEVKSIEETFNITPFLF